MAGATDHGKPPAGGFAGLVPELIVEDIDASLRFWCDALGFAIAYRRPEERFVYLERPEGAQIMLCERSGKWETGLLEKPYGRGVMFQIFIATIGPVVEKLTERGVPILAGPREIWRRWGDREGGKREVFVSDPDGYLIMLAEDIGERPVSA
jgi:catechol 2,3-dioxygenase-like lactoylglutathione lyase family enzyme